MNEPYTISDALAGSISDLLELPGGQLAHAKLLYMVYGYDQETYKRCWDALRAHWGRAALLVSIEQLPGTNAEEYPSGAYTVIHFRNISSLPVVCFHNGEFEGYNTSFGKIERIGNYVTGAFAAALLRWLTHSPLLASDPQRQAIAAMLRANELTEMLQYLFDTVRPHLEHIITYCNAIAQSPRLTLSTWGEHLHLLGLFRDPEVFKTPSSFRRSLNENHTLSQVGYWQRETNEHIRSASIRKQAKAILLGVLADSSRLAQAKQELTLDEIRSLVARSRRSAEQIAQTMIIEDLQHVPLNRLRPLDDDEAHTLAVQVLESFRNQEQQAIVGGGPPAAGIASTEYLQQVKSYLRRETVAAIQKALSQQSPIIATNIFLGILRCLLAWREEQEEQKRPGQVQQLRVEKLTVQGAQILPNPSREKWTALVEKIDQQIREQWKELLADAKQALRIEPAQVDVPGIEIPLQAREHSSPPKKRKKTRGVPEYRADRAQIGQGRDEAVMAERMSGEDPLLEQLHDLENGEPKLFEVSVQIVGSATSGSRAQSHVSTTFQLQYDPAEALFLQHLIGLATVASTKGQKTTVATRPSGEREAGDSGAEAHAQVSSQGMAWTCASETAIGTDIRSVGFALVRREVHLQVSVPQGPHLDTPGLRELVEAFTKVTEPLRERDEGAGYFSTLLLPTLPTFLASYTRLLLAAWQTEQDPFDRLYGPWIASLFTLDLSSVEAMVLTHIVTPFHPLQLRWRQTYEQLLMGQIERSSAHPAGLTKDFVEELEHLSSGNVPGVLTRAPSMRSPGGRHPVTTPSGESAQGEGEGRHSALSYPSTESSTGLFSGYKATLPRLQKLPSLLIRKIEQFLRIYPSAIDRVQISVISPGDLAVEQSLSQMFEVVQRQYSNAGFFTRIFVPDGTATTSLAPHDARRYHYDEEQGELRARTRYHLFPRTEFVTLRQNLLKTAAGQRFLFGNLSSPTQHLFLLLDHLGVSVQTHEIPPDAKVMLDAYAAKCTASQAAEGADNPPDLSVLLHQGLETFDERTQLWTRGLVDPRDAFSLLYYVIAARSQGHPNSLYRYICNLGRFQPGDFGSDTLIKTLHEHGIWVAIVDRAITREFFGTSSLHADSSLVLIDFHKGIGPQREYNLTISSTWTRRVRENVEMTLAQIASLTHIDTELLKQPGLATAVLRQFQNISGGLALQLAATDANTKGLLGLLVTAFEVSRGKSWKGQEADIAGKRSYTTVIPLDDHNDWFEREEIRTDLLVIHFEPDEVQHAVHLYFTCIECKFDESIQRASKGLRQLKETARRLQKRFSARAPEYAFRLRDLVEAIRSLAAIYRNQLPESLLELLWTNNVGVHLHLEENEIDFYLALYQIQDQFAQVKNMCDQHGYDILANESTPFQRLGSSKGKRVCVYRSERGVGLAFGQFIRWIVGD